MRTRLKRHKLIALLSVLLFIGVIASAALVIYQKSLIIDVQTSTPSLSAKFLIPGKTEIVRTSTLLNPESVLQEFKYNEVLGFEAGRAIVTKQNVIYYVEFGSTGEVNREVQIGVRPDLVLSMASKVLVTDDATYFIYVIPLRGIRLFKIDQAGKVSENYFKINEFFKLYSDNEIFVSNNKIYIPDGDLKLFSINLANLELKTENLNPQPCGIENWQINHNTQNQFILTSPGKTCVYDFGQTKALQILPITGNLWFKFIPELNLVAVEKWSMVGSFPGSTGELEFFALESGKSLGKLNLSSNSDFVSERTASSGGYSLLGDDYVLADLHQLLLFTRAGKHTYALKLDDKWEVISFEQVADLNYSSTKPLQ